MRAPMCAHLVTCAGGLIHMDRLEAYMRELSKQDRINCEDMGMNLQYLEAKTGLLLDLAPLCRDWLRNHFLPAT